MVEIENLNSVCYINKITKIEPIKDADKVELCWVNGWSSVTQKGIHKEGDLILCLTHDAVIPEELSKKWGVYNYLRGNSRVKTVKLRGVYSECILIPMFDICSNPKPNFKEGLDMMTSLGITKYEPPVRIVQHVNGRKIKYSDNPNFHIYYKFPNQKNVTNMFSSTDIVSITRKIHGTNARYGIVKKNKLSILDRIKKFFGNKWIELEYIYGSHNVEKGSDSQGFYSTDIWKEIADKYDIKNKLWDLVKNTDLPHLVGQGVILYGEIYGQGIQGNEYNYGLTSKEIKFFDIKIDGEYQNSLDFINILEDDLGLPIVEELYIGNWSKEEQDKCIGGFIEGTKTPHEGCVVKHISGDRKKVYKCINSEYYTFSDKNNIEDLEAH